MGRDSVEETSSSIVERSSSIVAERSSSSFVERSSSTVFEESFSSVAEESSSNVVERSYSSVIERTSSSVAEGSSSSVVERSSSSILERSSSSVVERSSSTASFSPEEDADDSDDSDASVDLTGELVKSYQGSYRITSKISTATFGTVYRCIQAKTEKEFVAKYYSTDSMYYDEIMPIINNEMDVMKRLNHPNTVCLADMLFTKDGIFMITDLVKGKTFLDIIPRRGGITECYARQVFSQLLDGLEHLHQHRIVHRDINLENVIIDRSGGVKIINYDLAEYVPRDRHEEGALLVKTECGSLKYLAPEIIKSKGRYYRGDLADIWAAGILLHVLVTGRFPFDHHKERTIRRKIRNFENHKNPALFVNMGDMDYMDLSTELRHLLRQIFVRTPGDRPSIARIREHSWMRGIKFETAKQHSVETFTQKAGDICLTFRDAKLERSRSLPKNCSFTETRRNSRNLANRRSRSVPPNFESQTAIDSEGDFVSSSTTSASSKCVSTRENNSCGGWDPILDREFYPDLNSSTSRTSFSLSDPSSRSAPASFESEYSTKYSTSSSESNSSTRHSIPPSGDDSYPRCSSASSDSEASSKYFSAVSADGSPSSSNNASSDSNSPARAISVLRKIRNKTWTKLRRKIFGSGRK